VKRWWDSTTADPRRVALIAYDDCLRALTLTMLRDRGITRAGQGAAFYSDLVNGSGKGASRTKPMTQVISSTRMWACAL
jgi:hypothetical protein